jgi:BirA family transcriptional regulator, biotin operon repressor / biotin---[acetyl-CoA-carboxylase] ligase
VTPRGAVPSPLRASRIAAGRKRPGFREVHVLGIVSSTNEIAQGLVARGAKPGCVVIADGQTAGRGRRGAAWVSTPGSGLFLSAVAARPRAGEAPLLAGAAGVASAQAIRSATGAACRIKWPNDLWVEEHKVGGVLIEVAAGERPLAVIGIGITLRLPEGVERSGAAAPLSGLEELLSSEVSREALASAVLDGLDETLALAAGDQDELGKRYRALDALESREIVAEHGGGTVAGRVVDVDLFAGIEIVTADRTRRRLKPEHAHIVAVLPRGG